MNQLRKLILGIALLLVIGALGLDSLSTPTWAAPAPRTKPKQDGLVITITVPIDIKGLEGRTYRNPKTGKRQTGDQVAALLGEGAENYWNSGLAPWRYRGCYQLKLDVQANSIPAKGNFSPEHHKIKFINQLFVRKGSRAYVNTPNRPSKHEDVDTAYNQSLKGKWGRVTVKIAAHEIGHLLGLSDDYDKVEDEDGKEYPKPLEGREGTLMAMGTKIDQDLVDRIGDLVAKTLKLPGCIYGSYELRVEGTSTTVAFLGSGPSFDQTGFNIQVKGFVLVEIMVLDDGKGKLVGEGSYTQNIIEDKMYSRELQGPCHLREERWSDPETQKFKATGTREGDIVIIDIPVIDLVMINKSETISGECIQADFSQFASNPSGYAPGMIYAQLVDGKYQNSFTVWTGDTGQAEVFEFVEERDVGQ